MPYLRRGAPYRRGMGSTLTPTQQQIVTAAQNAGVDPSLALAVAQQESGFNPNAVSSAGATGLFQLMPSTAASLGVNPSDPTQNIQGGIQYLAQLLQQYGGDISNALWAYNAGPGNQAKGVLPAETASYIPAVESLQSNWQSTLGTPTPLDMASGDDSSPASDSDDSTLLYIGLGLAAGAVALIALS